MVLCGCSTNDALLQAVLDKPKPAAVQAARSVAAPNKFIHVFQRTWSDYWRNSSYNLTRYLVLTVLGFVFGCVWYNVRAVDACVRWGYQIHLLLGGDETTC